MSVPVRFNDTLPPGLAARLDPVCDRFESAWLAGERPRLEDALALVAQPDRPALLRELLAVELECRLKAGETVRVEEYLRRFPELIEDPGEVVELIRTEFRHRERLGQKPTC